MSEKQEKYETLLPCPFCGAQPEVEITTSGISVVQCHAGPHHSAWATGGTREMAVRQWNTRAKPEGAAPTLPSAWDTWDGQTLIEPEPTPAPTPATAQQYRRKLFAEVVQGLIERGVITAEDVASVGGGKNE